MSSYFTVAYVGCDSSRMMRDKLDSPSHCALPFLSRAEMSNDYLVVKQVQMPYCHVYTVVLLYQVVLMLIRCYE